MPDHCDKRPVIVEQRQPDGTWMCCVLKEGGDQPKVMECNHEGQYMVMHIVSSMFGLVSAGTMPFEALPNFTDFRFTFVDAEPDDHEVHDVDMAASVIHNIMSSKL